MTDNLRSKAEARYKETRAKVSDAVATGKAKADDALKSARSKADDAVKSARTKADEAARVAKDRASKAAETTKASARIAADKTSEGIQSNPLLALGGGLALGAIVAALLPKSGKEDELLGNAGTKIRSTAAEAAKAAREAGKGQLENLGVNADAARDQVRSLVEKLGEAVKSASSAAADSVRKK